ncbi:MAG: YbaY family lipoprotein [Hyphomonadaceae bacterium]
MRVLLAAVLTLLSAGCMSFDAPAPTWAAVNGQVIYLERIALPRPGTLRVTLEDVSRADAPANVIASEEIDIIQTTQGPPFAFSLRYQSYRIERNRRYHVRAEIRDAGGELRATTVDAYPVLTNGAPNTIEVRVRLIGAPAEEPAPPQQETQTAPPAQNPAGSDEVLGVDFRAVGNEPNWMLDITDDSRLVLSYNNGNDRFEAPAGAPTYPVEGSTQYNGVNGPNTIGVTIQRFPCQDSMSGETFPARVTVVLNGRALSGCGRSL